MQICAYNNTDRDKQQTANTHTHGYTNIHINIISDHTITSPNYSLLTLISPAALRGPKPATNWTQGNR